MRVDSEVQVTDPESGRVLKGICRDLSGAGMSVELDMAFEAGATLKALLPSNNEAFPPLESIVRVVRCTPKDEGRFKLGLKIEQISR